MSGQASTATLKNGGALSHFSTRFIYDRDLEKDIAHRLYLGFETSKERGGFSKGKKVDRWFFWNEGVLLEVDYKDNVVQSAIKWGNAELLASKGE